MIGVAGFGQRMPWSEEEIIPVGHQMGFKVGYPNRLRNYAIAIGFLTHNIGSLAYPVNRHSIQACCTRVAPETWPTAVQKSGDSLRGNQGMPLSSWMTSSNPLSSPTYRDH